MGKMSVDSLLSTLQEIERLLDAPNREDHVARASALALTIAQNAPNGVIASVAVELQNSCGLLRSTGGTANAALCRLQVMLQDSKGK